MRLALKNLSKTQRILMVVAGLVLVGAAGLFGYVEYASSQYIERNSQAYDEARQAIYQSLNADQLTLHGLTEVGTTASQASDELCQTPAMVQWRVDNDYQAECDTRKGRLTTVSQQADYLVKRIEAEQLVAKIFTGVAKKLDKVNAGDYQARQDLWSQAGKDLANLSESETEPYQEHLLSHQSAVKQIIDRYDKLIAADKAKKRSQFDTAASQLQDAYENLGGVKNDIQDSYRERAGSLLDEVELLLAARVEMH